MLCSSYWELNHDTLTIWYQIDPCHFAYTAESPVRHLKLCGLLTQTNIFSTRYRLQINVRKAFNRTFFDILQWQLNRNKISILRLISLFKAFQRFAINLKRISIWSPLIIEPRSTCIWSIISFWLQRNWANKLNVTDHFHSFLAAKVDLNPVNIESEDS